MDFDSLVSDPLEPGVGDVEGALLGVDERQVEGIALAEVDQLLFALLSGEAAGLFELFGVALHADHPPGPHDAAHRSAELTQATPDVQHAIAPIERQRLQRAVVQQLVE